MSTIKTTNITHGSNSGTANMVLADDGKVTFGNTSGLGKLLNVVTASSTTRNQQPSGNDTWTDVAPTATITPSSTNSKILIVASTGMVVKTNYSAGIKLLRGSTGIMEWWNYSSDTSEWHPGGTTWVYIDSPSTTSATTYKFQLFADDNYDNFHWNQDIGSKADTSICKAEVYLLELGALVQ